MKRKTLGITALLLGALFAIWLTTPDVASAKRGGSGGRGDGPVIYVTGQELYYDSIVTADPLPPEGPFQDLVIVDGQLQTEFGPGDPGYVGGRWRLLDGDGNVVKYFSCPLLGPGRDAP